MASTRRRGAALEEAILAAGWEQLREAGYGGFTFEAIAERAQTGKAALYRRWPDKESLLRAVLTHSYLGRPREVPDTGELRGDVRSEEHTSELQSRGHHVCRLLLEKNIT